MTWTAWTLQATGLAIVTLAGCGSAYADPDILVRNKTNKHVQKFFATPEWYDEWGTDLLGTQVLSPGYQINIDVRSPNDCVFDLRAVMDDGEVIRQDNVNVCRYDIWTVHPQYD